MKISSRIMLALSLLAILVLATPKRAVDMSWSHWVFWAVGLVAIYFYGSSKDEN